MASSQGDSTFVIYDRSTGAYIKSFKVMTAGSIDGVTGTDGIDVTASPLGAAFPSGVFIAQDGVNSGGNQNFKLVPLQTILPAPLPPPVPTVSLSATPVSVTAGGASVLAWSSTDATECTASGGWSGVKDPAGNESTGPLSEAQTFGLSCTGPGGSTEASATVAVTPPPVPTVSLSATPVSVTAGGAATLAWSSTDATECTASGGWSGVKDPVGNESTGALSEAQTFGLSCTGPGGAAEASATVAVTPPPVPTVSLSATPASVTAGGASVLAWIVDGCHRVHGQRRVERHQEPGRATSPPVR